MTLLALTWLASLALTARWFYCVGRAAGQLLAQRGGMPECDADHDADTVQSVVTERRLYVVRPNA